MSMRSRAYAPLSLRAFSRGFLCFRARGKSPRVLPKRKKARFLALLVLLFLPCLRPRIASQAVRSSLPDRYAVPVALCYVSVITSLRAAAQRFRPLVVAVLFRCARWGTIPRVFVRAERAKGADGKPPLFRYNGLRFVRALRVVKLYFGACSGVSRCPRAFRQFRIQLPQPKRPQTN